MKPFTFASHTHSHVAQAILVKVITNPVINANAVLGLEITDTVVTLFALASVDKQVLVCFCVLRHHIATHL